MKYYVRVEESEVVKGKIVVGMNSILPMIKQGDELVSHPDYIEVDIEPTDDLFVNQNQYKLLDGKFVKMEESEIRALYPSMFND